MSARGSGLIQADGFALINWTDAARMMKVDASSGLMFEFWTQQYLGRTAGTVQLEIEPHGARILLVTDDAPVAAIGVDDCLCPTIEQHYENGEMTGRFLKEGETVYVFCQTPIEASEGCAVECICRKSGLWAVRAAGKELTYRVRMI